MKKKIKDRHLGIPGKLSDNKKDKARKENARKEFSENLAKGYLL